MQFFIILFSFVYFRRIQKKLRLGEAGLGKGDARATGEHFGQIGSAASLGTNNKSMLMDYEMPPLDRFQRFEKQALGSLGEKYLKYTPQSLLSAPLKKN